MATWPRMLWSGKGRAGAASRRPELRGKTSHHPQNAGTGGDEGEAGLGPLLCLGVTQVASLLATCEGSGWEAQSRAAVPQESLNTSSRTGSQAQLCPEPPQLLGPPLPQPAPRLLMGLH